MNTLNSLSHLNDKGEAHMVDVGFKIPTTRSATANCEVVMKPETLQLLYRGSMKKGDAFTVAKIAGIQAAKKTADLIPLCHPLAIEHIEIHFWDLPEGNGIQIEAEVKITGKTGVEMEALTAASVAALTVYDMVKAVDRHVMINNLRVIEKKGGKHDFSLEDRNSDSK